MPSDAPQDLTPNTDANADVVNVTTRGAVARARRRRLITLVALAVLLAVLAYVAFYYAQNRRLPSPRIDNGTQTLQPPHFLFAFSGTDVKSMTEPTGIGVLGNRVYVTDSAWRTVRAYTRNGGYLFDFGGISDGASKLLVSPVHVAVDKTGDVWVTDRGLRGVYIFDANGKFLRKFVPDGNAKFSWSPLAIAFGSDGDVYISDVGDTTKHRILVFAPDGRLITQWGHTQQVVSVDDSPGNFLFPNGVAVKGTGPDALVFVADGNNRRVQVFKADGTFVRIINTSGTPRGVALDAQGRLYVVDALSHRVDIYDEKGVSLANFGTNGVDPGQFNYPNDIVVDGSGRILITDRKNNQVQVWGYSVAEIPGVTMVSPKLWWLYLLPLPLLLLPLLRRRRFVVLPDFVDGMIAADLVGAMAQGRWRWVMTERDAATYEGRVVADAGQIKERFAVAIERAGVLAMAKHYRVLCTEDIELARIAAALGTDVYDRASWLQQFAKKH
jgi:sugar lactone lactonase YvrE